MGIMPEQACYSGSFSARLSAAMSGFLIPIQFSIALASGACNPLPLYSCRNSRLFHAAEGLPHSWLDFPLLPRGSGLAIVRWAFYLFSPKSLERGRACRQAPCLLAIPSGEPLRPRILSPISSGFSSDSGLASCLLGYGYQHGEPLEASGFFVRLASVGKLRKSKFCFAVKRKIKIFWKKNKFFSFLNYFRHLSFLGRHLLFDAGARSARMPATSDTYQQNFENPNPMHLSPKFWKSKSDVQATPPCIPPHICRRKNTPSEKFWGNF